MEKEKNINKLLKTARKNITLKYYGEYVWHTEVDYIEDLIRTHLLDNGYTIQDLQEDAPNIDDSQLKDFQLKVNSILNDLFRVYDGNILCCSYDYLEHFKDYTKDIDTILIYNRGINYLNVYASNEARSSSLIKTLCNEAWRYIVSDYSILLTTNEAKELLNQID